MTYQHTIPNTYDVDWILSKMISVASYGFANQGDNIVIYHDGNATHFEDLVEIIQSYPTTYADEVLRPRLLAQATDNRWHEMQNVEFGGRIIQADDATLVKLTSVVVVMSEDPTSDQFARWKAGPNAEDWITLPKASLIAMGSTMRAHQQACFNREEQLHIAIRGAQTVDDLNDIDLDIGWHV